MKRFLLVCLSVFLLARSAFCSFNERGSSYGDLSGEALAKTEDGSFFVCAQGPFYICTYADTQYFSQVINLINSIHKFNYDELGQIAVFNLGFTDEQVSELNSIEKVSVYDVQMTHSDLLKLFTVSNYGKRVRGWYAWKPVGIKQALEMFPHVLYIDAGLTVLKPLNKIFDEIQQKGYVLTGCGHSIKWMTPKHVIETFDLLSPERSWILDESIEGLGGGLIGLTKDLLNDFVMPIYELSCDLKHFIDDGTTPNGFGTARHDQTLFSIQAKLLGLEWGAWKDQAEIVMDGRRVHCFYKDVIIRTHHVMHLDNMEHEKIREYIRYKVSK